MTVFAPMMLAGKTAFCAGATSGINLRIAQRFREMGANVFIFSRSNSRVADAISQLGDSTCVAGVQADVRDFNAVEQASADCASRFGAIDIVLSGAAGNFLAEAAKLSPKGFRTVLEIDLLGGFHVMKACYSHLRRPGASIINISALQSFVGMPG